MVVTPCNSSYSVVSIKSIDIKWDIIACYKTDDIISSERRREQKEWGVERERDKRKEGWKRKEKAGEKVR